MNQYVKFMNRDDVIRIISDSYPLDIVSFDQEFPNEAYCIRLNQENKWEVYYSERGNKNDLKEFSSESEACTDLLKRMKKST
ncbi:hypothetical protein GCM10022393_43600 [Aquimarina addita]|uniref:Uncharacterized protein n=2 Tax=Aquimarina addita TaxID=870485 RepID=A0ABP6V0R8_9FLAO